eukprot:405224_1
MSQLTNGSESVANQLPKTDNKALDELLRIMVARFEVLVERGFVAAHFLSKMVQNPEEVLKFVRQNRSVVADTLNRRLNKKLRPSPERLERMGIVPAGYFNYDILNGFDNILLTFYFETKEIFVLDLLKVKRYKSQYCIPNDFEVVEENYYVMKMDTNIHIIDCYDKIHFKVEILDIIPHEIIVPHKIYHKPLITGYIRDQQNELSLQFIPLDVQMIVLNYFPLFL